MVHIVTVNYESVVLSNRTVNCGSKPVWIGFWFTIYCQIRKHNCWFIIYCDNLHHNLLWVVLTQILKYLYLDKIFYLYIFLGWACLTDFTRVYVGHQCFMCQLMWNVHIGSQHWYYVTQGRQQTAVYSSIRHTLLP